MNLDINNKKLLYELDKDCRRSYGQLGKKLHLGKNTIRYRIENLKKSGTIKGFHTLINYGRLGKIGFRLFISLDETTPEKEKEIIRFLMSKNEVVWLVSIDGKFNIGAFIIVDSLRGIDAFWNELLERYINYIGERLLIVLSSVHYFSAAYLGTTKKNTFIIGMSLIGKESVDALDSAILALLAGNALITSVEIGRKLRKTPRTIISRIRNLEERKLIIGYKCILDYEKLGYEYYRINFQLFKMSKEKELYFREFAMQHPHIVLMERHIGGNDFEIGIHVQNATILRQILNEIREKFADIIRSHEILHIYEEHKNSYLPLNN